MSYWNPMPTALSVVQPAFILAKIRAIVRGLAEEAKLQEPEKFAQAWHMLMKGSIVSAGEGNRNAARDVKCAAQLILDGWQREGRVSKRRKRRASKVLQQIDRFKRALRVCA
jgi:transcription initiation factor TFIIIB Brf1 subunit/transcription initiation factor TFIIB